MLHVFNGRFFVCSRDEASNADERHLAICHEKQIEVVCLAEETGVDERAIWNAHWQSMYVLLSHRGSKPGLVDENEDAIQTRFPSSVAKS